MKQRQKRRIQNAGDFSEQFIKLLESFRIGISNDVIFYDFCEMSALAIANAVPWVSQETKDREKKYLSIAGKYQNDELKIFSNMLGTVTLALEENPEQDFLGLIFMLAELGNDRLGQVLTPYSVSRMCVIISLNGSDDLAGKIRQEGYIKVCDPCVGAGSMLIAAFNAAREIEGINPQTQILFHGTDISPQAAYMAYIQCSLLGMSAVITIGDSLLMKCSDVFYTPVYSLNRWRFVKRTTARAEEPSMAETVPLPPRIRNDAVMIGQQMELFSDEAI
jgi:hypothetical protein